MTINIENLTFNCIIGILEHERIKEQKVIINLSFNYKYKKNYFIDYSEVSSFIEKRMKSKKFKLLEEAIIYFEKKLYKKYEINSLNIKISKPNILKNCKVSLSN